MTDESRYYEMSPPPNGRVGTRRSKIPQPDLKELGIGTRSCFAFRIPRTITTSEMSEGELSQKSQPSDEKLEKRGLLRGSGQASIGRSWVNSPETDMTVSMTVTPTSSPESDGYGYTSGNDVSASLLAMPTPKDRSHQRRLQMERSGRRNTYDGEQEPAGYRGQEATPGPSTVRTFMPTPTDQSSSRRPDVRMSSYEGKQEAATPRRQNSSIRPNAPSQMAQQLLKMPSPQDRSHRRRLQTETDGIVYTQKGEQDQAESRVPRHGVPRMVSPELLNDFLPSPSTNNRSHRWQHQNEPHSSSDERDHDPVGYLFAESDKILENVVRKSRSQWRSKGGIDNSLEEARGAPTGSPYLQFSPEGPALRVLDSSGPQNQLWVASTNSLSESASIASDEHIRLMVSDLVPLSPAAGKKLGSRVAEDTQRNTQAKKSLQRKPTMTYAKDKPLSRPKSNFGIEEFSKQTTPERVALATIRSGLDDTSDHTASTNSSVNLRSLMGDLLVDASDQSTIPIPTDKSRGVSDVNEMVLSAQNHVEQGEYDIALALFGRVLDIYRKQYGECHPLVASAYHNLGMVHSQRAALLLEGTLQQTHVRLQSLECFQAAARTARDSLGRNHPNVAVSLVKMGFLLLQARQYNPALITFEEALRIRTVHYETIPHHPLIANLHNNIGVANLHLQNFHESEQSLNRALEIQRHNLRVKRLNCTREELRVRLLEVADTLANLGGLALEWLRQEGINERIRWEAESQLAEALEIRSTVLGHNHPLSIQVRSLHEMLQSIPTLVRPETGTNSISSHNSVQLSNLSAGSNRGSSRVETEIVASREPFDVTRRSPSGQSIISSVSMNKFTNKSKDAPAPKAYSPSPLIDLITQNIASRHSRSTPSGTKHESSVLTHASAVELSPHSRSIDRSPPTPKLLVGDEDIAPLEAPSQGRRFETSEKTKIFVMPQYIPKHSSTHKSFASDESYCSDPQTPILVSDTDASYSHAYDMEESCLINESGDRIDLLSSFFAQRSDENDDEVDLNLSSHEIMVVRPSNSANSPDITVPKPLTQTIQGQPTRDKTRTPLSPPRGGYDKDLEENDDGIAPLSQSNVAKTDQKLRLSKGMLENPEDHLPDIHAAASRYLNKNRLQESRHLFMTILECQRKARGELHADVGAALHNVGLVHLRLNNHAQALEYFERAVRVRKGSLGREHPEVAVSQVKVGISLLLMHEFDLALKAFLEALSIRKRALGALHPSLSRIYNNIACVHVEFHELREARRAFEAALDIQRNALCHEPDSGPLMFATATTLCNLGYLYRFRDMHQKAALVLNEALRLQECVLGQIHPTVVTTMDSLADALSLSGGCSQALEFYCEILARLDYIENIFNRRQAEAVILYKMSRAHRRQNDVEAEVDKLDKALSAVQECGAKTISEQRRREQLEEQILRDVRESRQEMKKMQFDRR